MDEVARGAPSRRSMHVGAALRRVPTLAWMCALIAFLNASAWALIVPPFQGKDETDHFAYVEQLAENGTLPEGSGYTGRYSLQEALVLQALHYNEVRHSPATPAISSLGSSRHSTKPSVREPRCRVPGTRA